MHCCGGRVGEKGEGKEEGIQGWGGGERRLQEKKHERKKNDKGEEERRREREGERKLYMKR